MISDVLALGMWVISQMVIFNHYSLLAPNYTHKNGQKRGHTLDLSHWMVKLQ